ncbi:MAG: TlpA disulfide reductase family protein [Verrucomicrobia bacterium]|nr:TlpA disulfide reductase family protein [Verrucomicrobiota bacterium]
MKKILLTALAVMVFAGSSRFASAQAAANSGIQSELTPIVTQIREKLKAGKDTEADLADNLAAIDALIVKHRNDTKDEVAGFYMLKAQIYMQVLENDLKATAVLNQVKKDFAGTEAAKGADGMLAQMKSQAAGKAVQRALAPGSQFPDFAEKDLAGKPLTVSGLKGKVVLIDFWATWCPPCRAELPNVIKVYQQQHAKGFEVIGISLDSDRAKLESFIKAQNMAWPQYFDGAGWGNKLAKKYGVDSIPATYLLDREGKIIAKGLRGEALEAAVAKALAQK